MGKVQIVGIGPGNFENMTIRADRALAACDVIVGYPVYVDLVKDRYPGKELLATPMTQEAKRCRMALELAAAGKTVCLVCSGDSGIYGMAALVYQLRGEAQEPEVEHPRPHRRVQRRRAAGCAADAWILPSSASPTASRHGKRSKSGCCAPLRRI